MKEEDPRWQLGRKQTAWDPYLKNLAEMLEPHLAENTSKKEQNSNTLNPQPNKASPHHITLRKREGSCAARCWLQTFLGDADQQVSK
jgi:hypothetical protein